MAYINSAGVKLPNADIIIEANEAGTVISCRDVVTGEEYTGGESFKTVKVNISNTTSTTRAIGILTYNPENDNIYQTVSRSLGTNTSAEVGNALIMPGDIICIFLTQTNHSALKQTENIETVGFTYIGTASQPYLYTYKVLDTTKDVNLTFATN